MRMKTIAAASIALAAASAAAEQRLAVIVGADVGAPGEEPLRYAESDARRIRELLVELGGVRPERAILVLGGAPETLVRALTEVRGRAAEIARNGESVLLFFYYSGHGDDEALHLPRGSLPLEQLRAEMRAIPAQVRLSVLDACRSAGRSKGVRPDRGFALHLSPAAPTGVVELRASSAGQSAQESDELGGAIFTHYLISGLRGGADSDADGRVTLSEAYSHAFRSTLMRTSSGPALQHPAAHVELVGAGELVLSWPARSGAALELPAGADRYLLFALPSGSVVAEVAGGEPSTLAVPPGRYVVARRLGPAASIAHLELAWGGRRRIKDNEFRPVAREELVMRGGQIALKSFRFDPQLGIEIAPAGTVPLAVRAGVAAWWSRGAVELGVEVAYLRGRAATGGFSGAEQAISLVPALALERPVGPVSVAAIVGPELRYGWQSLLRADRRRLDAAQLPSTEHRSYGALGPRLSLRGSVPLVASTSGSVVLSAAGLFRREADTSGNAPLVMRPALAAAFSFGFRL